MKPMSHMSSSVLLTDFQKSLNILKCPKPQVSSQQGCGGIARKDFLGHRCRTRQDALIHLSWDFLQRLECATKKNTVGWLGLWGCHHIHILDSSVYTIFSLMNPWRSQHSQIVFPKTLQARLSRLTSLQQTLSISGTILRSGWGQELLPRPPNQILSSDTVCHAVIFRHTGGTLRDQKLMICWTVVGPTHVYNVWWCGHLAHGLYHAVPQDKDYPALTKWLKFHLTAHEQVECSWARDARGLGKMKGTENTNMSRLRLQTRAESWHKWQIQT